MSPQLSVLSRSVIYWAALAIALQVAVRALDIQYDGAWNGVWWVSEIISFPAHLVTEIVGALGVSLRGFCGRLFTTLVLAIFAIVTIEFFLRLELD